MERLSSGRGPFYTREEGSRTGKTEVEKVLEVSIFGSEQEKAEIASGESRPVASDCSGKRGGVRIKK